MRINAHVLSRSNTKTHQIRDSERLSNLPTTTQQYSFLGTELWELSCHRPCPVCAISVDL